MAKNNPNEHHEPPQLGLGGETVTDEPEADKIPPRPLMPAGTQFVLYYPPEFETKAMEICHSLLTGKSVMIPSVRDEHGRRTWEVLPLTSTGQSCTNTDQAAATIESARNQVKEMGDKVANLKSSPVA